MPAYAYESPALRRSGPRYSRGPDPRGPVGVRNAAVGLVILFAIDFPVLAVSATSLETTGEVTAIEEADDNDSVESRVRFHRAERANDPWSFPWSSSKPRMEQPENVDETIDMWLRGDEDEIYGDPEDFDRNRAEKPRIEQPETVDEKIDMWQRGDEDEIYGDPEDFDPSQAELQGDGNGGIDPEWRTGAGYTLLRSILKGWVVADKHPCVTDGTGSYKPAVGGGLGAASVAGSRFEMHDPNDSGRVLVEGLMGSATAKFINGTVTRHTDTDGDAVWSVAAGGEAYFSDFGFTRKLGLNDLKLRPEFMKYEVTGLGAKLVVGQRGPLGDLYRVNGMLGLLQFIGSEPKVTRHVSLLLVAEFGGTAGTDDRDSRSGGSRGRGKGSGSASISAGAGAFRNIDLNMTCLSHYSDGEYDHWSVDWDNTAEDYDRSEAAPPGYMD